MAVATLTPPVLVHPEADGAWIRLTLNAPRGNVLDRRMIAALRTALETHGAGREVRAVSLEGAGDHFSFGASVEEHQPGAVAELLTEFHELFRCLIRLERPLVAIVRGQCLGGGLELAAFCQFVFAAPGAKFAQPEIRLGVFPPVASLVLPFRIGQAHADDLCCTGRTVDAIEARGMGLVTAVAEDPASAARAFVGERLVPLSAASLRFAVRAARDRFHREFLERLPVLERLYIDGLMATADAPEGIAAFVARRPARWRHA